VSPARALGAFGHFWWEFLVGDTPELAVGSVAAIAVGFGVAHGAGALFVLFPAAVVGLLGLSVWRGRRR